MTKILFLDLDGTVRKTKSGKTFINDPVDQCLIDGVGEALNHYSTKGWHIVGITNQGGVAAGFKSLDSAIAEQHVTLTLCPQIKSIYFCPDMEGNQCFYVNQEGRTVAVHEHWKKYADLIGTYRKPNAGMLWLASQHENWESVPAATPHKFSDDWMIGDRQEDFECAKAAGINFMWADVWQGRFRKGVNVADVSDRDVSKEQLLAFLATCER